ncbi:MAG: flagellar hook-basal body complex protein [Alphaproteobacteria bacterium]|jgi:flagellar hook protein FlgE|nr:flagellar hook-basal body complex protein [Alphaproteobacteria bacterium]
MTLFGSLSSGVSGLSSQSSAMGAISDNITNVSTIGYKNTYVNFQTLVTKQTSSTFYSAGGVQSRPRQDTGVQGLLQASTSQTDISMSGAGYFVGNEAAVPTISNEFVFTRAGSFFQDNEGYLRNTSGFYLQAWPTDAAGNVTPNNKSLTIPNQNVISTDYLGTVNLNRVGGTAAATTSIAIGANLPTTDTQGVTHKTDVQFFDSLGNANSMSFSYTKTARDNNWDVTGNPPQGTQVLTLEDSSGNAFKSIGQLEFIARPADGASVVIEGITYEFDSNSSVTETASLKKVDTSATTSTAQDVTALLNKVIASDSDFDTINNRIVLNPGNSAAILFEEDGTGQNGQTGIVVDPTGLLTSSGTFATRQETSFTIRKTGSDYRDYEQFTYATAPATGDTITVNGNTYTFRDGEAADDADTDVARTTTYAAGDLGTLTFVGTGTISSNGTPFSSFQPGDLITFANTASNNSTFTVATVSATGNYITVATNPTAEAGNGDDTGTGVILHNILTDLEKAIESTDPNFASGSTDVRTRTANRDASTAAYSSVNTIMFSTLATAYTVQVNSAAHRARISEPDAGTQYAALETTAFTIDKSNAIVFNSDGIPSSINVAEVEILGFENGSFDMDDDPNRAKQISLDFGDIGEANGMTQFGAEYTPVFITTDGSQFGTFAGVTISTDGLVTALFDNGETRPVFKIPVATFTNVNALESRSGNVWNATEASGDPTLREADNGAAGQVVQAALEQSTVDIGEEFTKMIVVQRAFSASAKIISTADEMLEELLRTKR